MTGIEPEFNDDGELTKATQLAIMISNRREIECGETVLSMFRVIMEKFIEQLDNEEVDTVIAEIDAVESDARKKFNAGKNHDLFDMDAMIHMVGCVSMKQWLLQWAVNQLDDDIEHPDDKMRASN